MGDTNEKAILAGGCFWTMQQLLRDRDGVISTRVGWTGGANENSSEQSNDGHAEAVEVTFDPGRLGFRGLLEYFFQVHRPDLDQRIVGSGYRSTIFYTSEAQRSVAEDTIRDVDAARHWPGTVVTEITPAGRFWEAEPEDQDYFERHSDGATAAFAAAEPVALG